MVRETRHLWVGNLPDNIREERILEHFKRYGRVQSVKILPKKEDESGICATVAFIDIKSASKAHGADNKIEERTLKTDYYEPPTPITATTAIHIHERDDTLLRTAGLYNAVRNQRYPHGLAEERGYERSSHYYERGPDRDPYSRRPMSYHEDEVYQGRGRPRDRNYRAGTTTANFQAPMERTQGHYRSHNSRQHFDQQRYTPGTDQYVDERENVPGRVSRRPSRSKSRHGRQRQKTASRSQSGSGSDSHSRSGSRSSCGSRSSSSSSNTRSSSSSGSSQSHSGSGSRSQSRSQSPSSRSSSKTSRPSDKPASMAAATPQLQSAVSTPAPVVCQQAISQPSGNTTASADSSSGEKEEKRPLGICVRNLPVRSSDTSLKDGLFHEYKKHGKVTTVKVIGQGTDRYAVVCFKKPEDVEKALEVSKDKLFFGSKIEVTPHEGLDVDDHEFRPIEAELDEYHPKATRTLFIGNLEKDISTAELMKHFEQFGEIIEIDIKKQGAVSSYAFVQYSDITSVVKALRKMDGEHLGANRIKLGFGKSMPTNCVWLDGVADTVSEKFLTRQFVRFGPVVSTYIDREKGHTLIFYERGEYAQIAVPEMRGRALGGKKLQIDFASRECQIAFFEKMEMSGQLLPGERPWDRRDQNFDGREERDPRIVYETSGRGFSRFENQQRGRANFRGTTRGTFNNRGRGQAFSNRNYDEEFSQGSGTSYDDSYEQELREYGFSQRERRDYGSDERSVRGRSFSPRRRLEDHSMSPKDRHADGLGTSPHPRVDRPSRFERYDSGREDEGSEDKRTKFFVELDKDRPTKKSRHRSISDHESYHSQSPPNSRHQSRSISPPLKEKRHKERTGNRPHSPGTPLDSPNRDSMYDTSLERDTTTAEYRDSSKRKLSENRVEIRDPVRSDYGVGELESCSRTRTKLELDRAKFHKVHSEEDGGERLDHSSESTPSFKDRNTLFRLNEVGKLPSVIGLNTRSQKPSTETDTLRIESDSTEKMQVDDNDNDRESGELVDDFPEKPPTETKDLKHLQKEKVHILHLLEQLEDNPSSSDETGLDVDKRPSKRLKVIERGELISEVNRHSLKDTKEIQHSNRCKVPDVDSDNLSFKKQMDIRKISEQQKHPEIKKPVLERLESRTEENQLEVDVTYGLDCCSKDSCTDFILKRRKHGNTSDEMNHSKHNYCTKHCNSESICNHNADDDKSSAEKIPKIIMNSRSLSLKSPDSKPGTPLVDEPRREKDSPLSLPLPRFASSMLSPKHSPKPLKSPPLLSPTRSNISLMNTNVVRDLSKMDGGKLPPTISISPPNEKKSPNLTENRHKSPSSSSPKGSGLGSSKSCSLDSSSDSEHSPKSSPNRPTLEERIRIFEEKYNAWSGSTRNISNTICSETLTNKIDYEKYTIKKRPSFLSTDITRLRTEPSDIVKSLLAKNSIFDQDSKRLEHINEKYEPRDICLDSLPKKTICFRTKAAAKEFSPIVSTPRLCVTTTSAIAKFPFSSTSTTSPPSNTFSNVTTHMTVTSSTITPASQTNSSSNTSVSSQILSYTVPFSSLNLLSTTSLRTTECGIYKPGSATSARKTSDPPPKTPILKKECSTSGIVTTPTLTPPLRLSLSSTPSVTPSPSTTSTVSLPSTVSIKKEPISSSFPLSRKELVPTPNKKDIKDVCVKKETVNAVTSCIKDSNTIKKENQSSSNPKDEKQTVSLTKDVKKESVSSVKDSFIKKEGVSSSSTKETSSRRDSSQSDSMRESSKKDSKSNSSGKEIPMRRDSSQGSSGNKRRLTSVDSSESESSKSSKTESKVDKDSKTKSDSKISEPEMKKIKLSSNSSDDKKKSECSTSPSSNKKSSKSGSCSDKKQCFQKQDSKTDKKEEKKVESKSTSEEKSKSESLKSKDDKKAKSQKESKSDYKSKSKSSTDSKNKEKDKRKDKKKDRKDKDKSDKEKPEKDKSDKDKEKLEKDKPEKDKSKEKKGSDKSKSDTPKHDKKADKMAAFAFIEEEPVYFSMYDKVKARSSQNEKAKEKEKELETMREKFNQLKQSRAKREEKIKSTSVEYDSDKGSDVGSVHSSETNESKTSASKTKQHGKKKKLIIASDSEDDESKDTSIMSIDKSHKMKSDDDIKSEDNSETEVRDSREAKLKMKGSKEKVNPKSEEDSSDIEIPVKNKEIPSKRHKGKGRKKHEKEIKIKSRKKSEEESSDLEGSARTKLHTIKKEKTKKIKCNEIRITDDESIESENKFTKESLNILDKLKLSKDEEKMEVISPEPEVKPRKNSTSKKETKKKKEKEVKPKEEFPEFETTDEEQEEKVKNNKRKRSRKLSRKEKKQEEKVTKIHSTFEAFQTEEISEPEKVLEIPELKSTEDDKLQSDIMNIDKIDKPHINPFSEDSISNFADLEKPILSCSLELDKSDSEPLMPALVSKEEEGLESGSGREPEDLPKFSELELELNTKPTTLWTDEEFLSDEKELSIILPDKENTVTSQKSYDLNLEHESLLDVQQRKDVSLFESDDNMPTLLDGPIREDKKRKKSKKTSKEKKRKSKNEAPKLKDIYQMTNINMEEKESLIHEPEDVIEKPESSAESEAVKSIMADSAELVEAVRVLESQLQESLNENHEKNKMEELQNLQCQSDSNLQETEDEEKDLDASFHKEMEESQSEDKEKDPELAETKQSPLDIFEFTDDDISEIPARFGRDEHRRYRPSEEEQENRGRRHKGKKRRKTKEDKTKKEDLRIFRMDSKSEIDESLIDSINDEKLEDKVALEIPELKIETSVNKTPVHDIIPDLIAATESIPPADLEPVHDVGKSMMDADPEPESETDKAVATISQEETEDAVKALLEATFGSETYGNQEAPILEEIDSKVEEEMTKLVEEEEVEEPPPTEVLAEPQDRIPETQDRIPETPERIPETQDTISEAEDRMPDTQETITEELSIKEAEPSLPSEPNFHEDISIFKTDEEEEEEKSEEAMPSETSELNTSVEEPKVEALEVPNIESSKEDEISLKPPELPVPEEEPLEEVSNAIPEPVTNPTPEPEVVPDPTPEPEPEPEPVSIPDSVPAQNLEDDVKSPDFSEITIPDVKDEEPLSIPVMPPASALDMPVLDLEEKAQTPTAPLVIETRTRRGRRGKGRKYSDTSPVLKPEAVLAELQPTVTPIRQTGKRGRPIAAEKPRRTCRSEPEIITDFKDTYDMPKLEDVSQEPSKMEDENLEEVKQELAEKVVSAANDFKELKEELPPVLIPSLEEIGKEAENLPTVQEKVAEVAVIEKPEIPVKVEECKNKRQRRKKKSEPTVTLHSPPMLEKIDLKMEEIGEEIKPKENRFETKLRLPEVKFSSELKDNKFKENRFDVFEFRDEDDDETVSTFESTKERKEELKFSDVRFHHEERKISHYESYGESVVEKQKKDDSEKFSEITVKEEKDSGPERTRPRLILTIKSPHKDSHEKVAKVETREEPSFRIVERVEESKSELVSERNTFSSNKNSHDDRHSQSPNKSPATRKSQRLQEKSYRTTVDEVIEDVVKGHFRNIDTEYEPAPFIRPTRRNTRSRGRIEDLPPPPPPPPPPPEEKPEPMNLPQIQQSPTSVSDTNSKNESTDSASASDISVSSQAEANIVEPSKPPTEQAEVSKTVSLRTFRITRTQARAENMKAISEAHAIAVTSVSQSKGTENKESESKEDQKEISIKTEPTTSDVILSSSEVKLEVGQTTSKVFYSENKVNEKEQVTPKAEFKTPSIVIQSPEAKTTSAENKSETKDKSSEKPVSLQPQLVMKVELPKVSPAVSTKTSAGGANQEDSQTTDEKETESSPTALVDPVTGFLTPVRQSEEGTYVPATSAGGQGSAAKDSREGAAPAKISQPPPSPCRSPVVVYSKSSTPQQSVSVQSQMLAPPAPHTTPIVRSPQPSIIPNLVPSTAASKSPRPQMVNSPQPYIKEEAEHMLPRSRSQSLPRVTTFVGEPPVDISARGRSQSVSGTPASHETDPRLLHPAMVSRPPGQIGQPMPGLPHAWLYAPSSLPGPNSPAHQPGKASSPRPQTTVYQPLSKATLPSSLQSNPPVTVSPSLSKTATTLTTALNTGVIGMPPVATTASVVKTTCSSASKAQIPVTEIVQPSVRAADMTGIVLRPSSTEVAAIYKSEQGIPPPSSSSKAASSRTAPDLIPPRGVASESSPSLPRGAPSSSETTQPRLVSSKAQGAPSPKTSVQPRQSPVIPQQPAYPVPPYEAALHASHAYPPGSGGVIADLLQNPQYLLQQHKEYLSPHHSAGQLLERVPNQMMRPGTPVAVLPEVAARLGNPTPPHTPTPPTHTSITAQAEMIHLRHPSQPLVVHPHHPHVGVRHTADLPAAYMHQQMVYAAAHPHYASVLHPELRAQQAAAMQTRIPYSMSTGAAICHPVDSRAQVEAKPDTKDTRSEMKHPAVKEEKICERREERPVTADTSRSSTEGRSSSRTQQMQPVGQPAVRQPQAQYPPGVPPLRQVSPHLAISPHDRTTDSPIIANLYTQGQAPRLPYARPDQLKLVEVRGHEADPRSVAQSSVYLDPRPQMSAMPLMKQEAAASHPTEAHRPLPAQRPRSPTTSMRPPSPPPAHARSYLQSGCEIPPTPQPGSEAPHHPTTHIVAQPVVQPRTQPQTPPHASQVPPQGDSLLMLLQRYPVMWQGLLALKNDQAAVQMHFVSGYHEVALHSLPSMSEGGTPPLRIAQRMRLEQTQLEGVARRMQMEGEHCMLLALPCGRDHMDVLQQSNNLRNGFITYLQQKQAAGIVNVAAPGSQQPAYVVHIFPSCDFSNENLARIAPDLLHSVADIAHLLIVIATV